MSKKLKAKVNGVTLKDGDLVTVVVQARVKITKKETYAGAEYLDVELVSTDPDQSQWFDAYATGDDEVKGPFTLDSATIVKVKP